MVGWFQRSILKCYTCPRSLATYSHAAPFSPKKEEMCANADASTMTLSAFKMSYTFKCETSVCTTRSMFRALFATFSLASLVMTYAFSEAPTPHAIKDLLNAFVPGAEMLP